jgi:serine/threonine-protein kinase
MTTCPKCHHDVTPGASFCGSCGAAIVTWPQGAPPDPFVGQTFKGMYFVEMRIGGGGMGEVYRARHVTLDAPVALKILKKSLLSDTSVVQRFHREARAASRLRHPNVISVTDFGQTEDGTLFMAMEHVAGKSLAKVIAEEFPLPEQRIVHIGQQVLSALAEAHANQILHRDLKPENVMLESLRSEADAVKVLDFGIAKIQGPGDGGATLTQVGLVCGTPGYMSPEQWSGEELDARSDLYSVGVILYEMLTGKLPFEAQTPMEMVRKHLTEKVVPPRARRYDGAVSPDLDALVMRALSTEREGRPASADAMRDDLLACVVLPEPASVAHEAAVRRTVVIPHRPSPSPAAPRPAAPASTDAGVLGSPERTVRIETPGAMRRRPSSDGVAPRGPAPTPGSQPGTSPASPASPPRHEMDEDEGEPRALAAPPPPRRRSRAPFIGAAAAAAIAVLGGGLYAARHAGEERRAEEAKRAAEDASGRAEEEMRNRADALKRAAEEEAERRAKEEAPRRAQDEADKRAEEEARGRAEEERKRRIAEVKRPARGDRFESRSKLYSFPLPPAANGKGVLSISAEPPGGNVLVNGVAYGPAPREILVPEGTYHVRVAVKASEQQSKAMKVRAGTREVWTAIFKLE